MLLISLGVLAGGCGDDGTDGAGGTSATDQTTVTTDPSGPTTTNSTTTSSATTSSATTSSTTAPTSGTSGTTATTGLPGDPFDGFAREGDILAVIGVASDDKLNLRQAPGTDQPLLTRLDPLEDDLTATGRARALSRSIWYEVSTDDGITGWANSSFLGFLATVDDATAEFVAGGDLPVTETMRQMGELVAERYASTDPPSRVVQSVAPTRGDLHEITYDVVGIGDDSVAGYRLHVFAVSNGDSDEGFTLTSIERWTFCWRGVSGEACV